jgi:lysophospholipase L1-like esterase
MTTFRFFLAGVLLVFGAITSHYGLSIGFFAIPLALQFSSRRWLQTCGLCFGLLLTLLGVTGPFIPQSTYVTLQPNVNITLETSDEYVGIRGPQHLTTDHMGFRTTKSVDYERKPPDAYRIFAIGGSTTEQIYIDDRKTWTHLLQEKLDQAFPRSFEVVNTGVSGIRAVNYYATLKRIMDFHPDMAVILTGINDWTHDIRAALEEPEPLNVKSFALKNSPPGELLYGWIKHLQKSKPADEIFWVEGEEFRNQKNSLNRSLVKRFRPKEVSDQYKHWIRKIIKLCRDNGVFCVLLTQPHGYQDAASQAYRRGFWMTPKDAPYTLDFESNKHVAEVYNDYVRSLVNEPGVAVCDLAEKVPPSFEYMYDECHFNEQGARLVADELFHCLAPFVAEEGKKP